MTRLISTPRFRSAAISLLIAGMALMSAHALAADDGQIRFEVTPGITAQATLQGDGTIDVGTNRSSRGQLLQATSDEEGGSRLGHADYNFDGYQDLYSSASLGQVNESFAVYLYEPGSGQFRSLAAPAGSQINCEGLWSLSADAASRTLSSSCRGGPIWYTDFYRYQGGELYLYRSLRRAFIDLPLLAQVLALDTANEVEVLAVWSTWSPAGVELEHAVGNALLPPPAGEPLQAHGAVVVTARLPLHSSAQDAPTKRYLVKGDRVELLDEAEGWLQVRYRNPRRGPVLGWVKLPTNE